MARTTKNSSAALLPGLDDSGAGRRTLRTRATPKGAGVKKSTGKAKTNKASKAKRTKRRSTRTGSATEGLDSSIASVNDEGVDLSSDDLTLQSLAEASDTADCTFSDSPARLTTTLKVRQVPNETVSRLRYGAQLRLERTDDEQQLSDDIGHIEAWRIDKSTKAHPNAARTEAWCRTLIKPSVKQIPEELQELSYCVKALFTQKGAPKKKLSDAFQLALESNGLLFIQMIHIRKDFSRKGLLRHALAGYDRALTNLPEWFAFAGTIVLVPDRPEGEAGADWEDVADDKVVEILQKIYSSRGYERWVDANVSGKNICVMGQVVPNEVDSP